MYALWRMILTALHLHPLFAIETDVFVIGVSVVHHQSGHLAQTAHVQVDQFQLRHFICTQ